MTKYKGKNVRISDQHHEKLISQLPKKTNIGGWVEEAIDEKMEREKDHDNIVLQRYGKEKEHKAIT